MTLRIRSIAAPLVFVFAATIGACSSAAAPATGAPAAPAAAAAATGVDIQGFSFKTPSLEVTKGTKVTWTNKDTTGHTVTSGKPGAKDGKFDMPVPASGTSTFTFADAGTYAYFCSIHTSMTATVIVK